MKALLLAAGFGTRLRPITNTIPKCLVPIKGKPLLEIWLDKLTNAGVTEFLVNTHYLSEKVEEFLFNSQYKDRIKICYEEALLGTAGTLINNIDFFNGESGLLIHADNYCLADFEKFFVDHDNRPPHCKMTMMTFTAEKPELCGITELDESSVVINFHEKIANPPGNIANGAIYMLSSEFLKDIKSRFGDASDFSNEILPAYVGEIYASHTEETFIDIGTPKNYKKANSKA